MTSQKSVVEPMTSKAKRNKAIFKCQWNNNRSLPLKSGKLDGLRNNDLWISFVPAEAIPCAYVEDPFCYVGQIM
jgi:hypothetical protein